MIDIPGALKLLLYLIWHGGLHYVFFLCYLLLALFVARKICVYKGKKGKGYYFFMLTICFIPYLVIPVFYYGHFAFRCATEAEMVVHETVELGSEYFDDSPPYELKIERPSDDQKYFYGEDSYIYKHESFGDMVGVKGESYLLERNRDEKILVRIKALKVSFFFGNTILDAIYGGMPEVSCEPDLNMKGSMHLYRKALLSIFKRKEK